MASTYKSVPFGEKVSLRCLYAHPRKWKSETNKPPTQMGFEDETREPIMQAMMGIKGRDLVGPEDRIRATGEDRGHPRTNLTGSCHTAF